MLDKHGRLKSDKAARLLAAYPGPVTLKASRTGWIMIVLAVASTALCILAGVTKMAASAFEMGFWALAAGGASALCFGGTLQLDRNGFQVTLLTRKQYLWTEVCDFRSTSGVKFNVVRPRLREFGGLASSNDGLGDNFGLKAEELADLMESW